MDVAIEVRKDEFKRVEIFDFKESEALEQFRNNTTVTDEFSRCFSNDQSLLLQVDSWEKVLESHCNRAFKKVRIRKKKAKPVSTRIKYLIDLRNKISRVPETSETKVKLEEICSEIANIEAEEIYVKIVNNFKSLGENPSQTDRNQMWKLFNRMWPKHKNLAPVAKRNFSGKIVSSQNDIRNLLAREYKDRLRARPTRPDLESIKSRKEKIFQLKLKISAANKSPDWAIEDLNAALYNLKNKKCRDPRGLCNELFKDGAIGEDMKMSLLTMMNKIKNTLIIPEVMKIANISTVPKKGSRFDLKNERGIFRCTVLRSILMRLIYESKYDIIDSNMSDSQMGGRKRKGCRFNIFILNGIIHEVMKSKRNKPVLIQVYDYAQMFDSINLKEAVSDMFDAGMKDDHLALLYLANSEISMAVKTNNGLTHRQALHDIVLQGDTWGSLFASVQVDSIAKDCVEAGLGYRYKDELFVGPLGLVDDFACVTEVGPSAHQLNCIINERSAEKNLQFNGKKCKTLLVGKSRENVINNKLKVDSWEAKYVEQDTELNLVETFKGLIEIEQTEQQTYLGFVISSKGNIDNIKHVKNKSIGIISNVIQKLESVNLGRYYFDAAVILLNGVVRPSILYACETYYDLKESQIRQLERIEESFLRKIFQTSAKCPIVQLYLEIGHLPARFYIKKCRLMFLKTILEQSENSVIRRFFFLQVRKPSKGDWASACLNDLKSLNISLSFEEIQTMEKKIFRNIVNRNISKCAFEYLLGKQNIKGGEIVYESLELQEFLAPITNLSISDKRKIFAIRNRMVEIPDNFKENSKENLCICNEIETMKHVYECKTLNIEPVNICYEKIFNGNIKEQTEVMRRFEENMGKRIKLKESK